MKTPRKAAADASAPETTFTTAGSEASQSYEAAGSSTEGGTATEDGAPAAPPVSGLTPTRNPVRNAYGLELDRFGLPVNGPARAAVLVKMAVADPALDPGDWDFRGAERAAEVMENIYG